MGAKRKTLRCECGGIFKEEMHEFQEIQCLAMVCSSCKEVMFTLEQSKNYHRLKGIQEELASEVRKIGRVGNSMGITLPVKLKELGFKIGKEFDLKILDDNRLIIKLRA